MLKHRRRKIKCENVMYQHGNHEKAQRNNGESISNKQINGVKRRISSSPAAIVTVAASV